MHVKFIVLPLLMNMSGPPMIVVMGSEKYNLYKELLLSLLYKLPNKNSFNK